MIKKTKKIISNFSKYSFLMKQLIIRDFKVKYKRSFLGVLWSLLYPILMITVMAIVFSQLSRFRSEGMNYIVYLMTGIIMMNYFSEASNNAMTSVVMNFGLLNKVYIPKYIFPFSKCLFVGINFALTLIPWLIIIALSYVGLGEFVCHFNIYYLIIPYIFICFIVFTMGIGLLLSCVSVFLRDMFYIYGIILTIWNYLTPIFYSVSIIPDEILPFYVQNPLYIYITAVRNIVLLGERPSITMLGVCTLWAIGSLVFGSIVFKKNQDKFIYYI